MDRLPRHLTDNLLVSVTVCFLAGATLAPRLPASWPVWTVLAPIGLCAVAALVLDPRFRPLTALPFFLLVGLLHTHTALHPPADPHHIAGWIGEKSRVTLTGRMLTMAEDDGEKTRFELAAESLLIHGSESRLLSLHLDGELCAGLVAAGGESLLEVGRCCCRLRLLHHFGRRVG